MAPRDNIFPTPLTMFKTLYSIVEEELHLEDEEDDESDVGEMEELESDESDFELPLCEEVLNPSSEEELTTENIVAFPSTSANSETPRTSFATDLVSVCRKLVFVNRCLFPPSDEDSSSDFFMTDSSSDSD